MKIKSQKKKKKKKKENGRVTALENVLFAGTNYTVTDTEARRTTIAVSIFYYKEALIKKNCYKIARVSLELSDSEKFWPKFWTSICSIPFFFSL